MRSLIERLIALPLLLLSLPLVYGFGWMIRLRYPGKILYSQERIGHLGKPFKIWKLRTMVSNSDVILKEILVSDPLMAKEWDAFGCFQRDPRVTGALGRFARQYSIDELMQFWNVVKGEMALIGPRPLDRNFTSMLKDTDRQLRLSVKPGITGLWQVGPRSATTHNQMMRYDRLYLKNKGWKLDMYILMKTFKAVFNKTGF